MKHRPPRLALAVTPFLLVAWLRASVAQADLTYAVAAWGHNDRGQTTVPVAAQSGVVAIAAGWAHTVALKIDGSVVSWGSLGVTTVPVTAQSGVTAIAAGSGHTVALKNDGTVVAWGHNDYGQTTIPVAAQNGVMAIAAGESHTVVLKNDGSVVAWGRNDYGQRTIPLSARNGVTAIAAGWAHTVALKNDGSVVAWGNNQNGQRTVPLAAQSGVSAIAAGDVHTVALKNDGSVIAWGNSYTDVPIAARSGVTAIEAGGGHTVALKNDGTVVAWGGNYDGQVTGTPTFGAPPSAIASPVTLGGQVLSGVKAIAAGASHTVALVIPTAPNIITPPVDLAVNVWQSASFTVAATGYPLNYQWRKDGVDLAGATSATYSFSEVHTNHAGNYTVVVSNSVGSVTNAPPAVLTVNPVAAPGTVVAWGWNGRADVPVAAQSGVVAITASAAHTVALKDNGSVVVWGVGNFSQTDVPIAAQSRVTAIAAGGACDFGCNGHTVALKDDGTVVAWGRNDAGQVTGTPATDGYPYSATASPVTIGGQVLSGVTAIAAGWAHSVALKDDGMVVAWGANSYGQVTGTAAMAGHPHFALANPVTLGGQVLTGVIAIAAGATHTVALKNDGTVVAWGANETGQVTGTPATDGHPNSATASPVTLGGQVLTGVTAIAAGSGHTLALKNDGTVVAWGYNGVGEVTGTPTTDEPPYSAIASPVNLEGQILSGVTAIAASYWIDDTGSHTVVLRNDGTVVAWGHNDSGQVASTPTDGLFSAIASPVKLEGRVLSGVTAIAAGGLQTLALISGPQLLPSLKAKPHGNELILSWPTNAPGFTLQSTPDLTPPMTWTDSTSMPAVTGAHFTLTNTPSVQARFYRLRKR